MVHVRLPYRITLTLGTFGVLAILAGCGRDANQSEVEALRREVADLKAANAQLQTALASREGKETEAAEGDPAKPETVYRLPVNFSPRKGPPIAAVMVVEFADFQCPFCKANAGLPDKLLAEFPGQVQFAFKHYPIGKHAQAFEAAKASWAAHQQGKFWEMHDTIYSGDIQNLSPEVLRGYAQRIGLDMAKYEADIASPEAAQAVQLDKMLGKGAKVKGTPTYFVNGKRVRDASAGSVRAKVQQEIEAFGAQAKP